jgi:hypothetical protein
MIVLKADAPVAAQAFIIASQDNDGDGVSDRRHCIIGSLIQGSNDGINWETLRKIEAVDYEDYLEEDSYFELSSDDTTTEYTYFRYVNNDDGAAAIGEFVVVGPAAPETEAPETEAPADEVVKLNDYATIIKGEAVTNDVTAAFDGNKDTGTGFGGCDSDHWAGIKLEQLVYFPFGDEEGQIGVRVYLN